MQKWLILLALALFINILYAQADGGGLQAEMMEDSEYKICAVADGTD